MHLRITNLPGKRFQWVYWIALLLFLPLELSAENTIGADYRTFLGLNPRYAVWFIAELHLLFAAFVLGVPIFVIIVEYMGVKTREARYDHLARESTALLSAAYATTAALGGLLAFAVFNLYPKVMGHLAGVMHNSFYLYALCFFGETFILYLYYYSWDKLNSDVVRHEKIKTLFKIPTGLLGIVVIPLFLYLFFFNGVGAFPEIVKKPTLLQETALQEKANPDQARPAKSPKEEGQYSYKPIHPIYIFFSVALTLFLLSYGIYAWASGRKTMHMFLGALLNVFGMALMLIANSWATYMMSPTGLHPETMKFIGSTWDAVSNTLWRPLNLHRLLGNIAFGGFIVGAYAAVKFLAAKTDLERAHYDWMGYVGNFIGISGMILLPFAGYYLGREVYSFSPVMGNDMMGGFFSWTFVLQAVLIGTLFIGANYYLWTGMERIEGAERYRGYIKFIIVALIFSFMVWITPHNLPLTPSEQAIMGGQYHPVLKYLGLMPAKNAVIQFILLSTFFSFMLYRRANKGELQKFSENAGSGKIVTLIVLAFTLFVVGYYAFTLFTLHPQKMQLEPEVKIIFQFHAGFLVLHLLLQCLTVLLTFLNKGIWAQGMLLGATALIVTGVFGVTGFWVMEKANPFLRHLAVCQVLLVLSAMFLVQTIDVYLYQGAQKVGGILWGKIGKRPQYALITLSVSIVMLMGLMGYVRSGLRQEWHVFGVLKDTSPQASSPYIYEMTTMVGAITVVFFALIIFVFWLRALGEKKSQ